MKTIIKTIFNSGSNSTQVSIALLIMRLAIGSFMLTHGFGKLMMLLADGPAQFADPIGMGMTLSLVMAVFAEFICSILILFGFGTRLAAIPLLFTMFVAVFIVHAADPFAVKELAALYGVVYLVLTIAGAGKYSLDYLIGRKLHESRS